MYLGPPSPPLIDRPFAILEREHCRPSFFSLSPLLSKFWEEGNQDCTRSSPPFCRAEPRYPSGVREPKVSNGCKIMEHLCASKRNEYFFRSRTMGEPGGDFQCRRQRSQKTEFGCMFQIFLRFLLGIKKGCWIKSEAWGIGKWHARSNIRHNRCRSTTRRLISATNNSERNSDFFIAPTRRATNEVGY